MIFKFRVVYSSKAWTFFLSVRRDRKIYFFSEVFFYVRYEIGFINLKKDMNV